MTLIKVLLLIGVVVVARFYWRGARSALRDRLIIIPLALLLAVSVVYPDFTSEIADLVGVTRGVDLAIYLGFLLIYFIVGMLRTRVQDQERKISALVRHIAILEARAPEREPEQVKGDIRDSST